jgi:hypothetical protein
VLAFLQGYRAGRLWSNPTIAAASLKLGADHVIYARRGPVLEIAILRRCASFPPPLVLGPSRKTHSALMAGPVPATIRGNR